MERRRRCESHYRLWEGLLSKPRVLVTGGAGFIGSHIVDALLDAGSPVTVLDDFSSGFRENLNRTSGDLRIIEGTIQSADDCRKALEGVASISHQAAFGSVPRSVEFPELYSANNLHGSTVLIAEAQRAGVRSLVLASSSSVYGDDSSACKKEERLGSPLSPYAASKRAMEIFAQSIAATSRQSITCLRYFNVFGPRQNPNGPYAAVIPQFLRAMLRGERPPINGDGEQARDFTYVENVVAANIAALSPIEGTPFRTFNIACGSSTSVNQLFYLLRKLTGSSVEPEYGPERRGDIKNSTADIQMATANLEYLPIINLEEGLRRTVQWYQSIAGLSR